MANRFLSDIRINDAYTFPASDGSSGQVITTDGSGNLSFAEAGTSDSASVIYRDNFTGDGSTASFDLQNSITDEDQTQIYIDGVYQEKDSYSVSGSTITFTTAPISGHSIEVISISAINTGPTVIYQDNFTGNGSATDFTLANTIDNEVKTLIFLNGVYQFKNTYSVDGTTLSFDTAPVNGVDIEVISIASALQTDSLQAGSVIVPVKNTHTASIAKGTPVYISGNVGNSARLQIAPADASNSAKMPAAGLLLTTLAVNAEGYAITGGYLRNITTDTIDGTSTASNDTVYVKAGGGLTMTKPTGSNLIQNIAKVARSSGGNSGSLLVSSILRTNDIPNIANDHFWLGNSSSVATATSFPTEVGNYLTTNSYATENYVDTEVAGLVASAPATLDTLNELAAALGDDPNFATTTANSIGTKLPLAGGTLTGALLIQQSSTSTGFTTEKTGGTGSFINLKDTAGSVFIGGVNSEFVIQTPSGSYSNKLTISNSGNATFAGDITIGNNASIKSVGSVRIDIDEDNNSTTRAFLVRNNGGANTLFRVQEDGSVGIGTDSPDYLLDIEGASPRIRVKETSSNTSTTMVEVENSDGRGAMLGVGGSGRSDILTNRGYINAQTALDGLAIGTEGTDPVIFYTQGLSASNERMRITSGGNIGIGTGADVYGDLHLEGGQQDIVLTNTSADGVAGLTISRIIGQARGYSNTSSVMQSIDFVTNSSTWYKGDIVFKTNNTDGTDSTVAASERMRIKADGSINIGARRAALPSNFGYSGSYKVLILGSSGTNYQTDAVTLSLGVDVTGNPSGAYNGNGREIIIRNEGAFISPNTANNGYNTILSWNSSGQPYFSQNVGIGTTGPNADLEVKTLSGGVGVNTLRLNTNFANGNTVDINPFISGLNNGGMEIKLAGSQKLVMLPSGDVGIGTASPESKLHVYKNAAASTVVELLRLDCGENSHAASKGGSIVWRDINVYSNTASITAQRTGLGSSSSLQFGLRGGEKMRITSAGDVLINATGRYNGYPASFITQTLASGSGDFCPILELVGNRSAAQGNQNAMIQFFNKTSTAVEVGRISSTQGSATNSGGLTFHVANAGSLSTGLSIGQTGRIILPGLDGKTQVHPDVSYRTTDGELFYQTSSERYKTDIVNLENSLNKVNSLRPVRFTDTNTNEPGFGLIAEETNEIIPEVVFTKDEQIEGISYSNLVPFLIKSIQELKADNDSLKARIETLENN